MPYEPPMTLADMIVGLILLVAVPAVPIALVCGWLRALSVGLRPNHVHVHTHTDLTIQENR